MKTFIRIISILFLALWLCGCGGDLPTGAFSGADAASEITTTATAPSAETAGINNPSLLSEKRISVFRNHVNLHFVLSEDGIYCQEIRGNGCFALYCDRLSEQFVVLCGRPDCLHQDQNCDAFIHHFPSPMGYWDGKLYYFLPKDFELVTDSNGVEKYKDIPASVWQMDPDGRNKQKLMDCYEQGKEEFSGYTGVFFTHGYVELGLHHIGTHGEVASVRRYGDLRSGKLLGDTAAVRDLASELKNPIEGAVYDSDGDAIIIMDYAFGEGGSEGMDTLYVWDPAANTLRRIGRKPANASGWFGTKEGIYLDGAVIKRWDYAAETGTPLFDTGLEGNLILNVYPDCLVVSAGYSVFEQKAVSATDFWFYDWNFTSLGHCRLPYEIPTPDRGSVFGETAERLLFVGKRAGTKPDYYINKSDFGKEEIPLHEYHYPEMDLPE